MALQPSEMIVSQTDTLIARAGYANTAFLVFPGIILLLQMAARDLGVSPTGRAILVIITGILAVYSYTRAIGRLLVSVDGLRFTCATGVVFVPATDVLSVRLAFYSAWQMGTFLVKRKSRRVPEFFYYIAPATSFGDIRATEAHLRRVLREHQVAVK